LKLINQKCLELFTMKNDTNNALSFLEDIGYVYALYAMMLFSIFIRAYHFKILSLSILNYDT